MPSPCERLHAIVTNVMPSKVVFKAHIQSSGQLYLIPSKTQEFHLLPNSDKLQALLAPHLYEAWNPDQARYLCVSMTPHDLFQRVKNKIIVEYAQVSARSDATKRKTEIFVQSIELSVLHLANYVLQLFIEIHSEEFLARSRAEKQNKFEILESLRRTYGKH